MRDEEDDDGQFDLLSWQCRRETYQAMLPKIGSIKRKVLQAFKDHGQMTRIACRDLPEFAASKGTSTVQARICELNQMGLLDQVGKDYSHDPAHPSTIWAISRAGEALL